MKISKEDVTRVAELAHLDLSPAEIETYRGQLDAILTYVDKLKELDVTGIEPMTQVLPAQAGSADAIPGLPAVVGLPAVAGLREDVLRPCDVADPILAAAPDLPAVAGASRRYFRVPKVIER